MLSRKIKSLLLIAGLGSLMIGCTSSFVDTPADQLIAMHHDAAGKMIKLAGHNLEPGSRMIAASFADINDLESSSPFGRMASQQLVSSLSARNFPFVEMLMRNSVYIDEKEGEFLLSREVAQISAEHNAPVVLVGTYAVGADNVFVTSRLIRTKDNVIIASYDYSLPYTQDVRTLLRKPIVNSYSH